MNNIAPKALCMVHRDRIEIITNDEIRKEDVGAKAYGLSAVPSAWTLPFLVISSEMHEEYISGQNIRTIKSIWNDIIVKAMHIMHFDLTQNVFLRSNMCVEDLAERGQFESYDCGIERLFETIKTYFDSMEDSHLSNTSVPILIQQYSQVIGKGHVSNERRLSKEHRDWKGEIEKKIWNGAITAPNSVFSISLRNWRRKVIVNETTSSSLLCSVLFLACFPHFLIFFSFLSTL